MIPFVPVTSPPSESAGNKIRIILLLSVQIRQVKQLHDAK